MGNIYGNIVYPNSSFVIDKIYPNYTEAKNNCSGDEVLLGRYILICYCDAALTQNIKHQLESNIKSEWYKLDEEELKTLLKDNYSDNEEYYNYVKNYIKDNKDTTQKIKISNDRVVYRKEQNRYTPIANLSTTLSDDIVKIREVDPDDPILSVTALDEGKLYTTLKLGLCYNEEKQQHQLGLIGKDGTTMFGEIDASAFVKDSFLKNVEYNGDNNTLTFSFITKDLVTGENIIETVTTAIDIDIMDPGNGIQIDDNDISIKLNPESEHFLTLTTSGLKLSGIQDALNAVKNKVIQANSYVGLGSGVNIGDIGIVTTTIAADKTSYTAYVWNGTAWIAMDGNYNAENVYFDEDIMVTKEIGYITLTNGNGTIPSKGKNLVEVFDSMFTKEQNPSKTDPSVDITLNGAGSYEVGTTVTGITCSVSFNDGAYSYGPEPTGVEVNSWEIKDSKNQSYNYSTSAININNVLVTDGINYTITAKANHTIGDTPKTNKGNECKDSTKRIAAGTKEKTSSAITGYREGFFYGNLTTVKELTTLTSDDIRGLSKTGTKYFKDTKDYGVSTGTAMIIFACPANEIGITNILNTTVNANMNDVFNLSTPIKIDVDGANGYDAIEYNVWAFTPAKAYDSTAKLAITFG